MPVHGQLSKNVVQHPPWGIIALFADGATARVRGLLKQPGPGRETQRLLCLPLGSQRFPTGTQQTHFVSDPGAWLPAHPPPRGARGGMLGGLRKDGALPPALPQPALLRHRRGPRTTWRRGRAPRKEEDLSPGRTRFVCVISVSPRRKLLISCPVTAEEIEVQRRGLFAQVGSFHERWD